MENAKQPTKVKKFRDMTVAERLTDLGENTSLTSEDLAAYTAEGGLSVSRASAMIENAVGVYSLPIGIAQNFVVNGRLVLIPMVTEEPSVVAAASMAAKLVLAGGGFTASMTGSEMIGQLQVSRLPDLETAVKALETHKEELLEIVRQANLRNIARGGGPRDIEIHQFNQSPMGPFLVLHLIYDVCDAMGANMVNTIMESLAEPVGKITGGRVGLRILSNLADRRLAKASCKIPVEVLKFEGFSGEQVRDGIIEAWAFAAVDPYRASTHNKGIMNGVDAVVMATGNDWCAIEAGAHAYAVKNGHYGSLSTWKMGPHGELVGEIEMPMAVGIVGGATRVHPTAKANLKVMEVGSAQELGGIIASVGLAQNLGALRALATEGIQHGHMALHARQIAIAVGAEASEIDRLTAQLISEN
ncbi:MAG TPA: hydroxymethylglutaryl-CoA reductase, degradative, partial [Anaerolineaceae bacterium]|nr:hydroxymethylglutaryl-CoA reductase, degradative [Anaerolineaceae bacterium]